MTLALLVASLLPHGLVQLAWKLWAVVRGLMDPVVYRMRARPVVQVESTGLQIGPLPHMGGAQDHVEAFLSGRPRVLNLEAALGFPPRWDFLGHGLLYNHQLAGLEPLGGIEALPAGAAVRELASLLRQLPVEHPVGRGWLWTSPYVAATRLLILLQVLAVRRELAGPIDAPLRRWLGDHLDYVASHPEYHIPGNHLVRQAQTLVIGGLGLRGPGPIVQRGLGLLRACVADQILPDGGHFEICPMYHCQVLRDLLQVKSALKLATQPVPDWLQVGIEAMGRWLSSMLLPDGQYPAFGDSSPVAFDAPALLAGATSGSASKSPEVRRECGVRLEHLASSGFVVARAGSTDDPDGEAYQLVLDVGPFGPVTLPAHGHADALSFILYRGRQALVIDPGVLTYEPGEARQYYRGTAAHATLAVDGQNQTEVWGRFRAGRRAVMEGVVTRDRGRSVEVTGCHSAFRNASGVVVHERWLSIDADGVAAEDRLRGGGACDVEIAFPLAPGLDASLDGTSSIAILAGGRRVATLTSPTVSPRIETGRVALDFNHEVESPVAVLRARVELPATICWTLR